ncbi:Zn(II)2Cys6 transcription factor, partial [Aspergillus fijiensis CBS 313.89]
AHLGCLTCRARKAKCDETHPLCNNCRNLDVECQWGQGSRRQGSTASLSDQAGRPSDPQTRAGPRSPACFTCRYARSRCSKTRPSCTRCAIYGHECSYPETNKGRSLTSSAQSLMQRLRSSRSPSPAISLEDESRTIAPVYDRAMVSPPELPSDESRVGFSYETIQENLVMNTGLVNTFNGLDVFGPDTVHNVLLPTRSDSILNSASPSKTQADRSNQPAQINLPSQDRLERLAVAFFIHVHVYRANAFLHRDRTLTAIRDGTLSAAIVLALCAVGGRFSFPVESEETVMAWATDAGVQIIASTDVNRDNIAASLLLTIYYQQAGQFARSHLWSGIAINQAITLGLHREAPLRNHTFVESERDRRIFYACYAMSRLISNGAPESIQCPSSRIRLKLPCDGFNYRMDVSVETPYAQLEEAEGPSGSADTHQCVGAMGFWVRLVGVRTMTRRYFHTLTESQQQQQQQESDTRAVSGGNQRCPMILPSLAPWSPSSPYAACMAKLALIRESLPIRFQLSRERVAQLAESPVLGQIVLFYLWWNICHIELCSMALTGYAQSLDEDTLAAAPDGWVQQTRQNCLRHAQAITDVLELLDREVSGHPLTIYDHTVAHVVYLSLRVQLEVGLVDDEIPSRLRNRFEMMLAFVKRTSTYFRSVQLVVRSSPAHP